MESVAIVGVGLIGGSFGLALRQAGFRGPITGVSSPRTIEAAVARGAVDRGEDLETAVPQADLVYLSGPIRHILEILPRLARLLKPGALVTDAGSTKSAIVETARRSLPEGVFLGGHPMAGKESSGVASAEAELFRGRPYLVTPLQQSGLSYSHVPVFLSWLERIGAIVHTLSPADHDRLVARISHLPQIVSTVLAASLEHNGAPRSEAAGPGIVDMTRLALSPYHLWEDIFATNREEIEAALSAFAEELGAFREAFGKDRTGEFFGRAATFASGIRRAGRTH